MDAAQAALAAAVVANKNALDDGKDFARTPSCNGTAVPGCTREGGDAGVRVGWQERFVRCGGLDTLIDLLLTRDWDSDGRCPSAGPDEKAAERVGRVGSGLGFALSDSRVGVSLACQSLLADLVGRFMNGGFLPTRWEQRQARLVSRGVDTGVRKDGSCHETKRNGR